MSDPKDRRSKYGEALASVRAAVTALRAASDKIVVVFGYGSYGDGLQITPLLLNLKSRFSGSALLLVHASGAVPHLLGDSSVADKILTINADFFEEISAELKYRRLADLIVHSRYVVEYIQPPSGALDAGECDFVSAAQKIQRDWKPSLGEYPFDNDVLWQRAAGAGLNVYALMALTGGFADRDFETLHLELTAADFAMRGELPARYYALNNSAQALIKFTRRGGWTKCLSQRKMAGIVARLRELGLPSVQLGAEDDPAVDGVDYDWRGHSSLRQAAAVMREAVFWLAPEGGISNLGQAVGKPGIVFFGSTPPQFFAFRNNVNILPQRCGGCWFTTPFYLHACPRLLRVPECGESISETEILDAARRWT